MENLMQDLLQSPSSQQLAQGMATADAAPGQQPWELAALELRSAWAHQAPLRAAVPIDFGTNAPADEDLELDEPLDIEGARALIRSNTETRRELDADPDF